MFLFFSSVFLRTISKIIFSLRCENFLVFLSLVFVTVFLFWILKFVFIMIFFKKENTLTELKSVPPMNEVRGIFELVKIAMRSLNPQERREDDPWTANMILNDKFLTLSKEKLLKKILEFSFVPLFKINQWVDWRIRETSFFLLINLDAHQAQSSSTKIGCHPCSTSQRVGAVPHT